MIPKQPNDSVAMSVGCGCVIVSAAAVIALAVIFLKVAGQFLGW